MTGRIVVILSTLPLLLSTLQSQSDRVVTKTFSLTPGGRLSLDTYKGSITIDAWDKNEVSMEARITAEGGWSSDDQEDVELVDIFTRQDDSDVTIETSYRRLNRERDGWGFWNSWHSGLPSVHYVIHMPSSAALRVDDYKSESHIAGLNSDLSFETYKGDATIADHDGEVRIETYKGEIAVSFKGAPHESRFETYKGEISVAILRTAGFDVRCHMGRRADLRSDFDIRPERRSRRRDDVRFNDSVNGGGPTLSFETSKGTIRIDSR